MEGMRQTSLSMHKVQEASGRAIVVQLFSLFQPETNFFNLCPHSYTKGLFCSSKIISLHKLSWKCKFPIPRNIKSHRFSQQYKCYCCLFCFGKGVLSFFSLPTHHFAFRLGKFHRRVQVIKHVYNPSASASLVLESQMYANILDKMVFHSLSARFQHRSLNRPGQWMTTEPFLHLTFHILT